MHIIVALDAQAVQASVRVVSLVTDDDLARPTPCGDWTLAGLIAHMTVQHDGFAAAAAGDGADLSRWLPRPPAAHPVGEYAEAAARVVAAFGGDGVLDREFALPELSAHLRFPATQAIGFHLVDYVVHGWDVARSLGLEYGLEPELLAAALAVARKVPDGEGRRRPGAAFAPRVTAAGDGNVLDEIVALLGRRPGWPELPLSHERTADRCGRRRGRAGRVGRGVGPGQPGPFGHGPGGVRAGTPSRQFTWQRQDLPAGLPGPALRAADRSGAAAVA